jgi:hypothetical protein
VGRCVACEYYVGRSVRTNLFDQINVKEYRNKHHEENVDISDIHLSVGFGESVCPAVGQPGRFHSS